jgi:hypothetical protein
LLRMLPKIGDAYCWSEIGGEEGFRNIGLA